MMRVISVFVLVAVGCMLLVADAGAADKKPDRPKATKVAGVLKAVDVDAKSVTIAVPEKKEKGKKQAATNDVKVTVDDKTKIKLDGKDATLTELAAALKEKPGLKAGAVVVNDVAKMIMAGEPPKHEKKEGAGGEKKKKRGGDSQI